MLDYSSISAFAKRATTEASIDYAILNAGVMPTTFGISSYGWETTLQVNLVSTTLIALLLLPKLQSNKYPNFTPVLEMIGSGMHLFTSKLSAPEADNPSENPLEIYSREKNFNAMGGQYMTSKLFLTYVYAHLAKMGRPESKSQAYVQVVCPGLTQSGLGSSDLSRPLRLANTVCRTTLAKSTEKGARTYIAGLTLGERGHGKFWQYDQIQPTAPLLLDEKTGERQERVCNAVIDALRKDLPDVDRLIVKASQ